jgi:predicted PurR-regulated permease PerM
MTKIKNTATFAGIILLIFALLAIYWGYIVLQGVFVPLLFAMIIAVVFYPGYLWLLNKTKSPILSSLLTCLALVLIVLAVISFAVYLAVGEVVSITKVFTQTLDIQNIDFFTDQKQLELLVNETITNVNQIFERIPFIDTTLSEIITELLKNIPTALQSVSAYLLSFLKIGFDSATKWIVQLIIFFISLFFLLIDGKSFVEYTFRLLPINALHERQIMKRFSNLCYSWIVVSLLVAFIQGSLAALGFALIGVPSPLIWGIITMFASFVPFIGGSIIWATIGIIYLILGYYWSALFIVIWGFTMISSSDNVLRPFLLKEGVKIHPLILFLAVLGGFFAFSVPGLIIGPLIIVFISTLLYIYQLEFEEELNQFHYLDRKPKKGAETEEA